MPGFLSWLETPAGKVPRIRGRLRIWDHLGRWKVRWGIGRHSFMVPAGLYALGRPGPDSPVVVTANFKASFDLVRSCLNGRHIWLLVLETYGINVWCAAGKGTFGTDELVRRIESSGLKRILDHRTLLLPILGAPGVAAYQVAEKTGFRVRYATIRAADLPEFLDNGGITTPAMREVTFTLAERLALIPVELILSLRFTLPTAVLLLLAGWWAGGLSQGLGTCFGFVGAVAAGAVAVPVFLPWLPGAGFAFKGTITGLVWSLVWLRWGGVEQGFGVALGSVLALTVVSSFYALNFTGSTPFTSRSGVRKEMRLALPIMGGALVGAMLCWSAALLF